MTQTLVKFERPCPFGALVHEDAVVVAVLARVLLRIGERLFGDEEDARAVVGPLERTDRGLLIGQLRRFTPGGSQQPELRAGGVAAALGLIAGREKRHVAAVRRPRRRAILVAAEQLSMIGAVGIGDPDRSRHACCRTTS